MGDINENFQLEIPRAALQVFNPTEEMEKERKLVVIYVMHCEQCTLLSYNI